MVEPLVPSPLQDLNYLLSGPYNQRTHQQWKGWKIWSFWKRVTWDSFVFILIYGLVWKTMNLSSLELYSSHCWFIVKCRIWFSSAHSWSQSFKITCGLFSNLRSVTKICFLLNWKSYHIIVANEMLIWKSIDFKLPHGSFQPFGPLIPQSVPIHTVPIIEVSCDWRNFFFLCMFLGSQRFIFVIFSSVIPHRGQPAAKCHP